MARGSVIRYDSVRGYGFIAPSDGGDDVFLHVNDLRFPGTQVHPGAVVEFEVAEGERGLKATEVSLVATVPDQAPTPSAPASSQVLTPERYRQEVTEVLLRTAPSLTAQSLVEARRGLIEHARSHGWIEG
ncbi:cold-shock protein [Streptomyces justiciae]|uniref:cold-shock protein n=1 Tax=Streptomyces justiciae TaxID=2780140 RepID=UPI00187F842E|nr:cold shock domain-containing protein [Streptomyces justiciae]MBE8475633.1 cold shock domain-containing protein [Streptomyces justiciae]MCW8382558.1 cold shock domain-containing protein [Streptomyces justiciae]